MISTGALPSADPFSFTVQGRPWFAWEWASDVGMALAHRWAGLPGIAFLFAVAISAAVWLWFQLNWAAGGDFLIACLLAPPMLSTTSLHWMARPHVFGWLLLLILLIRLESCGYRREWGAYLLLGAVWANVHASFFLAPFLCFVYAASHVIRPVVWNLNRTAEFRKAAGYASAGVAAGLGTLLNPYGAGLHRHVIGYLGDRELLARIGEFQSFNYHVEGAFQILLVLAVGALGGSLALGQRRVAAFIVSAIFLGMALRSARVLPLAALVVLPLANASIRQALEDASYLRPSLQRRLRSMLQYSAGLRRIDLRWSGLALAPLIAGAMFLLLRLPGIASRTGFPADQFPVVAAAAVERLPATARLMAPDKFGGYLIYRFEGRRKVFFDGRSDLYGAAFLDRYGRMVQVRPGWMKIWDSFSFTHALLPDGYSLIPALEREGWVVLHRDAVATLLARPPC